MSYLSHSGANVPGSESSWERKFQGAKVPCNFRFRERKFQGAKVPGSESSTYGTFALGSESTWKRKFQLPLRSTLLFFFDRPLFNVLEVSGLGCDLGLGAYCKFD